MDREEFYKKFWDDLRDASKGTNYQSGEQYFNSNFGSSFWFTHAQNASRFSRRQGRRPNFSTNRNLNIEVVENVGLNPLQAFRKRDQFGTVTDMMVSSFLFEMFTKHNNLFWLIIDNISLFQILYARKQYHQIFKLLSNNASR